MNVLRCGLLTFQAARERQEELIQARLERRAEDTLLVVEHPPTLSLGIRTNDEHCELNSADWEARGVEVVRADRGGSVTFHAPGQLVLYPVVALRERGFGVREFVSRGLKGISSALSAAGVRCEVKLQPAGVWIVGSHRKICSVGLKIHRGVTNHGFSVNISCELSPFSLFPICGEKNTVATSAQVELGVLDSAEIEQQIIDEFLRALDRRAVS